MSEAQMLLLLLGSMLLWLIVCGAVGAFIAKRREYPAFMGFLWGVPIGFALMIGFALISVKFFN